MNGTSFLVTNLKHTDNFMHNIYTLQNSPEFIERFRAQGRTYDRAKNYTQYIILLSIVITLALSICSISYPKCATLESISLIYGLLSTILCLVLESIRAKRKNLAARIQQLIDSELYGLQWERYWGEKPTLDEIQGAAKGEPEDRYINWYDSAITKVSKDAAILICFRCNFNYDQRLRAKFLITLNMVFWGFLTIVVILCYLADFSFSNILKNGVAPALPVLIYYFNTIHQLAEDKGNLERLRTEVITMQENLIAGRYVAKKDFSSIQTLILKSRESCLDIPTCFYHKYRTINEEGISAFANRLAEELLQNPKLANE